MADSQLVSVFIAQGAGVSGSANYEICQNHKTHKMSRFVNETNLKVFHVSNITQLRLHLFVCLFVCLLYIQSIHTWSKPQDIEFVIINYIC